MPGERAGTAVQTLEATAALFPLGQVDNAHHGAAARAGDGELSPRKVEAGKSYSKRESQHPGAGGLVAPKRSEGGSTRRK